MSVFSKWTRCDEVQAAFPEGCAELHQGTTIVTGPTTGIGVTTAIAIAATGGRVVLAARSQEKAETLADQIRASVPDAGPVVWIPLDLRSLRSVAHCAQVFGEMSDQGGWGPLKCVVANAGMFNMTGNYHESEDGFEETFAVNYLGHFYLTQLLMPRLRQAAPSRVVCVSSGSHFGPLATKDVEAAEALRKLAAPEEHAKKRFGVRAAIAAYGSSKLAMVCLARSIDTKFGQYGVTAASLHPGTAIATSIARQWRLGMWFHHNLFPFFTKDHDQGSATTVYCCVAPGSELRGRFFSDCAPHAMSPLVTDAACEALWGVSEALVQKAKQAAEEASLTCCVRK